MSANINSMMNYDHSSNTLHCTGQWTVLFIEGLDHALLNALSGAGESAIIDGTALESMDSAGALMLHKALEQCQNKKQSIQLSGFSDSQMAMLQLIAEKDEHLDYKDPPAKAHSFLYHVGEETFEKLHQLDGLTVLIGELSSKVFFAFADWRKFHIPSIFSVIFSAGLQALPILALLSFLIGIVLAYQMGTQLQIYGANIFVAVICGTAIFREFGPLITAIIVAGRTSSAFTAQLGSMKVNEEVDALRTMGLSPIELLMLPKIIGLILVFPLLIFWADAFALFGSMVMSKFMLQINYTDFLSRIQSDVGLKHLMLGLYKAPAFGLLIALVGCFQGFRVESSSDSIGSQTTKSVVQALFLIIIADAAFSILYSWLGL